MTEQTLLDQASPSASEPPVEELPQPHMTDDERGLFNRYCRRSIRVVEFGSGGSTFQYFRRPQIEVVVTVESDPEWLARLRAHPMLAAEEASGRWVPIHGDIGPTKQWGYPVDGARAQGMAGNYHAAVWRDHPGLYDLVLVDGRFRIACALQAIPFVKPRGVVMIHDFDSRPGYAALLKFFDEVAHVDQLIVLKPRRDISLRAYTLALNRYYTDAS